MAKKRWIARWLCKGLNFGKLVVGAAVMTLACFLVLPGIQALGDPLSPDTELQSIDTAALPPPPPETPEEEPEPEEEEPEEAPPELTENTQPLDLNMLSMVLNPGFGDGWPGMDTAMNFGRSEKGKEDSFEELFALGDMDQKPRATYQAAPVLSRDLRKRTPATVHVIFIVDVNGRVTQPKVQKSSDPAFDGAAITAIKKWKFEPAKRDGQPVPKKMVVPITFPKGNES